MKTIRNIKKESRIAAWFSYSSTIKILIISSLVLMTYIQIISQAQAESHKTLLQNGAAPCNCLAAYVWTSSPEPIVYPTVVSIDPIDNSINVVLNKTITASFSLPMDTLSLTMKTFILKQGENQVSGKISYSGSTASFIPTNNLLSGNIYTATITTGAKNTSGRTLANNYVWNFSTIAPLGGTFIDLKSVAGFGIIAGVSISNNAGISTIQNLDVGLYPGEHTSITGFPPAIVVNGMIYAADDAVPVGVNGLLIQAKQDLTDAYLVAQETVSPTPLSLAGNQGGVILNPGVYQSSYSLSIEGSSLTLDAQGDVNAVWIFQIASTLTSTAGGNVILIGGAQAKNIFWQVGSSATIGDGTSFKGNILALTSITMNTGATIEGRLLAINGSVVLTSTNTITKP